jgi:CubicO group peptidase (beta-lactamase class C family)
MTIRRRTALILLAFASSLPMHGADLAEEVDVIAKHYHEQYQFNGTVLVAKAGEVAFKGAYGMANREWNIPHSVDTRFRVGSITKQFTAALILQLVSEGKVDLEAPLSRYVPEYPAKVADRVTVHQLLTHTSGIRSYTSMPNFRKDASRDPYTPVEFLKFFADEPLDFEPGDKFQYNNSGYLLLGVIIEKATGKSYAEELKERIFGPLGMTGSGYDLHDALIEKRASAYDARLDGYRNSAYLDMSLPYAAGSLYSTVEDLYRWDRALAAGKVLSDEMSEKMFKAHVKSAPEPDSSSYGYGWVIEESAKPGADGEKIRLIGHGGGINGFNTLIQRIPADGHLIVLLNNSPGANLNQMAEKIRLLLYAQPAGDLKKSSALAVYHVYQKDGVAAAAARWKEIRNSAEYLNIPPEAMRLIGGVANTNPQDGRTLLEQSDLPQEPPSAGLWLTVGDAFATKRLRDDAARAYASALQLEPGMAQVVSDKLRNLSEPRPQGRGPAGP